MEPTQVVGKRIGAALIDLLIMAVIIAAFWYILTRDVEIGTCTAGGLEINDKCRAFADKGNRAVWFLVIGLSGIGIFWLMQGLTGKTPGKAIFGIRTVNAGGQPPGVGRAAVRSILGIVDGFPYFIPYLVGFIVALNSKGHQRIGDKAADTYVVAKEAVGAVAAPSPAAGLPQGSQPADWYPDPHGQARLRYWDGQRWTEHTSA
jgi:uncharacterized RDD family membrane protein YckC